MGSGGDGGATVLLQDKVPVVKCTTWQGLGGGVPQNKIILNYTVGSNFNSTDNIELSMASPMLS